MSKQTILNRGEEVNMVIKLFVVLLFTVLAAGCAATSSTDAKKKQHHDLLYGDGVAAPSRTDDNILLILYPAPSYEKCKER
jgi:hypothetical protein